MATPIMRRDSNQSNQPSTTGKSNLLPLKTRRFAAWAVEFTLLVVSGLVPFGIGVYANSNSDVDRVPLHPVLVTTERAIAYPLALPVSYGTRNVAWVTNFFWSLAILAPLGVSGWQLYLLAKTGSTTPKGWFGVRVVNQQGTAPGMLAVGQRELVGRWIVPISLTYILWRSSFAFPNLGVFMAIAAGIWLLDGTGLSKDKSRRAWHDRLAGTYTIDDTLPFSPEQLHEQSQWTDAADEEEAIASIVITPESEEESTLKPSIWKRLQQYPSLVLIGAAIASIILVLGTLISVQIYTQIQQNNRADKQRNSQQFISLLQKLNSKSRASNEEKRNAILAMGTLDTPQANQFLVDLLVKEANNPQLSNTIAQALVNLGLKVIPNLKRANQSLSSLSETGKQISAQEKKLKQRALQINIQVINKILTVHSGNTYNANLSRVQLVDKTSKTPSLKLKLDKVDVWGINFKYANLNQGSFKGSRFRGAGKDGRWDTYDDWITDLSGAQMQRADLTDANLSRVLMVRTNLSRANLKRANLINARMVNANLSSSQLVGANLQGAVLENASLTGADLGDAKLNEADLYGASLGRVIAIGTQLSHANLTNTNWQAADLSGADLHRANLRNANFSATRLKGAIFSHANLENAKFRNADLSLADLRGANLTGADFQGAILSSGRSNRADQFIQTPTVGAESAVVQGVDFTQVKNLDPRQVAYICTQGALHPRCP